MSGTSYSIQWAEVDTAQTLGTEFKSDINRITKVYDHNAIWVRQNGEEMYMTNMTEQHIINALRMCKRNLRDPLVDSQRYEYLLLEAIRRDLMKKDVGEWDSEENK